ncbi:MAG: CopD family protein [Haloarculaceae archaeon]
MAALLHLAVRILHVLGMVALLGGAAAVWYALRAGVGRPASLAVAYEWLFWVAIGVMVATGVGNLGAVGAPGPATRWGRVLTGKLLVVTALVAGSFVRTAAVQRIRERDADTTDRATLRRAYGATAGVLGVVVALAEVLAHG